MGIVALLIVGGALGWLTSLVTFTDRRQGIARNLVVGIIGAVAAGFLVTPLIGGAPFASGSFDTMALIASFIGASILLALVNLFHRGEVH
ncbi:MAG: GlsB/YeaQ/YmgE family stress response membrane protein [Proteobacteria bacterium]|nr:GlsB/YeaQ/YmgE family stress response membrane protein [Pseudomonadota bacterium]MDE2411019.1 GlsB/YeaQ/YmgE family stress response membrane protein [Sphingomonadales bacterium]